MNEADKLAAAVDQWQNASEGRKEDGMTCLACKQDAIDLSKGPTAASIQNRTCPFCNARAFWLADSETEREDAVLHLLLSLTAKKLRFITELMRAYKSADESGYDEICETLREALFPQAEDYVGEPIA